MQVKNSAIIPLYFLVCICLLLQLGNYFNLPLLSPDHARSEAFLNTVRSEMKNMISDEVVRQINTQIHELVLDKIHLDKTIEGQIIKASKSIEETVMKVGTRLVSKKEFLNKLEQFSTKSEFRELPREDRKQRLVQELKKHYAVVQDAKERKLDQTDDFQQILKETKEKLFLSELLKQELAPLSEQDIQEYYKSNLSLYEKGRIHTFKMISGNPDTLAKIHNPELFSRSELPKKEFNNAAESQLSPKLLSQLKDQKKGEIGPVIHEGDNFYILLKTEEPRMEYIPLSQAAPFIKEQITYQRIRDYLNKITNPLRFEFRIDKQAQPWTVNGIPLEEKTLAIAREILPAKFLDLTEQNAGTLQELHLKLQLLFEKFNLNPLYYPEEVQQQVQDKLLYYEEALMVKKVQGELSQVNLNEQELKDFYDTNKNRFVQSEGQLVHHIFIRDRSQALKLLNYVLMDPASFEQMAKERSQEPRTAPYGGDMRYLAAGDISDEMNKIASSLKEGEVFGSLVAGAHGGWHILKFARNIPAKVLSFDEIKPKLRALLTQQRQKDNFDSYLEEVQKKFPSQVDEPLLAKL
jgi:peptidyl-prolyl cis-trans isomerase C